MPNKCTKTQSEGRKQLFKRQLTSTSCYEEDPQDDDNNPVVFITKGNKRKQRISERNTLNISVNNESNDITEQSNQTKTNKSNSRLFIISRSEIYQYDSRERIRYTKGTPNSDDSTMNHYHMVKSHHNLNANIILNERGNTQSTHNNDFYISQQALNYAANQHLPPLFIKCTPKINGHQKEKEITKALFVYIEKNFKELNKHYETIRFRILVYRQKWRFIMLRKRYRTIRVPLQYQQLPENISTNRYLAY